jgi:hypothetical protein
MDVLCSRCYPTPEFACNLWCLRGYVLKTSVLYLNAVRVIHCSLVNKQQFFFLLKYRGHWHCFFTETLVFWLLDKCLFFYALKFFKFANDRWADISFSPLLKYSSIGRTWPCTFVLHDMLFI